MAARVSWLVDFKHSIAFSASRLNIKTNPIQKKTLVTFLLPPHNQQPDWREASRNSDLETQMGHIELLTLPTSNQKKALLSILYLSYIPSDWKVNTVLS